MTGNVKQSAAAAGAEANKAKPKRVSKKEQLVRMLSSKAGADIMTISKKFAWQPHTTRAALTGLRKAGFELAAEKPREGKPARYRITSKASDLAANAAGEIADAG